MQKLLLRQISEENFKTVFTRIDGELDKLIFLEQSRRALGNAGFMP